MKITKKIKEENKEERGKGKIGRTSLKEDKRTEKQSKEDRK